MNENKMGVQPISKLLISMSLPIMLSMLVQAFYNIIDSMFVAKLSEDALTAVSLVFPIQNLMIAFAAGTGVGMNALLSRHLGEKKEEDANITAKNGVLLSLVNFVLFAILGIFFSELFMKSQTSNPDILRMGKEYMMVVTIFSFGIFVEICFERLLQSTGRTIYTMYTQGVGAILNIIFDPLLIFGIGPFPKMGVTGAAVATVFGQIVAMLLGIYFNHFKNPEINLSIRNGFKPDKATILTIYKVGLPAIVMQSVGSVMVFGMNKILMAFSSTAAAVLGVYFKLQSFVFMPIFGLNNGMIPIIAYNYGAKKKKRITSTIKISVLLAAGIMVIGLVFFQFGSSIALRGLFSASDHMVEIGVPALRIISISFLFAGFNIIVTAVFQALGNGIYSLIISIVRQLVFLLPLAYIFSKAFGLHYVWWAFPLAEVVAIILCALMLKHIYKTMIKPL